MLPRVAALLARQAVPGRVRPATAPAVGLFGSWRCTPVTARGLCAAASSKTTLDGRTMRDIIEEAKEKQEKKDKSDGGKGGGLPRQARPKIVRKLDRNKTPGEQGLHLLEYLNRQKVEERLEKVVFPWFTAGHIIEVTMAETLEENSPVCRFTGLVIARQNKHYDTNFTIRNVLRGVAVEQQLFLYSPYIRQVRVIRFLKLSPRSKLYFLRDRPLTESTFKEERIKFVRDLRRRTTTQERAKEVQEVKLQQKWAGRRKMSREEIAALAGGDDFDDDDGASFK